MASCICQRSPWNPPTKPTVSHNRSNVGLRHRSMTSRPTTNAFLERRRLRTTKLTMMQATSITYGAPVMTRPGLTESLGRHPGNGEGALPEAGDEFDRPRPCRRPGWSRGRGSARGSAHRSDTTPQRCQTGTPSRCAGATARVDTARASGVTMVRRISKVVSNMARPRPPARAQPYGPGAACRPPATRTSRSGRARRASPRHVSGGITEASPMAPTHHAEPAECSREPAQPEGPRCCTSRHPQAAEDLAVGGAEAIRHRLDRLPHGHRLGRVRRVQGHDRAHAGIEHETARHEQHRPDQPDRGRGLHQRRSRRLQAFVRGPAPGRTGRFRRPRR